MIEVARILQRKSFKRSFQKLPPLLRTRVQKTLKKLRDRPELPGLHVEPVAGTDEDLWSCRVNRRVRIIFSRGDPGTVILEQVAEHDEAYRAASWQALRFILPEGELVKPKDEEPNMFFQEAGPIGPQLQDELDVRLGEAGVDHLDDVLGSLSGLISRLLEEGTDGRASTAVNRLDSGHGDGQRMGGLLNVIPSDASDGHCREVLLALCFDADSFDNRLHDVMKHAEYKCPETKMVVFITSKWEPKTWKGKWQVVFEGFSADVMLLMAGPTGLTQMA